MKNNFKITAFEMYRLKAPFFCLSLMFFITHSECIYCKKQNKILYNQKTVKAEFRLYSTSVIPMAP